MGKHFWSKSKAQTTDTRLIGTVTTEDDEGRARHAEKMGKRVDRAFSRANENYTAIIAGRKMNDSRILNTLKRFGPHTDACIKEYQSGRLSFATSQSTRAPFTEETLAKALETDLGYEDEWTYHFVAGLNDVSERYDTEYSFRPTDKYKTPISRHIEDATKKTLANSYRFLAVDPYDATSKPSNTATVQDHVDWWSRRVYWWHEPTHNTNMSLDHQKHTREGLDLADHVDATRDYTTIFPPSRFTDVTDEEDGNDTDKQLSQAASTAAAPSTFTPPQTSDAPSDDARPSCHSQGPLSASGISLGTALLATTLATGLAYTAYQWWKD